MMLNCSACGEVLNPGRCKAPCEQVIERPWCGQTELVTRKVIVAWDQVSMDGPKRRTLADLWNRTHRDRRQVGGQAADRAMPGDWRP